MFCNEVESLRSIGVIQGKVHTTKSYLSNIVVFLVGV